MSCASAHAASTKSVKGGKSTTCTGTEASEPLKNFTHSVLPNLTTVHKVGQLGGFGSPTIWFFSCAHVKLDHLLRDRGIN